MLAYEKFDIFKEALSFVPNDYRFTYTPLLRACFLFNFNFEEKGLLEKDAPEVVSLALQGSNRFFFPPKRIVKKAAYFKDYPFLESIISEVKNRGVKVERLAYPAKEANVDYISNKQHEEALFFSQKISEATGVFLYPYFKKKMEDFNSMVMSFYKELKGRDIDLVFLRCHYSLYNFPLIFACKMLGVTVVDVQHGINGFKHLCYSKFKGIEINSPLLPDVFWTWSDMATKMLTKDSSIESVACIVEGGNPIFSSTESQQGKKLLYTHQPQSKGIPIPIEEIKRVAEIKKREVVVRPHPLHVDEAKAVLDVLKKEGVKSRLEDPHKISINDSLSQTSVHVTYSSTCALDALNFGIPSVYCSDLIGDVEKEFSTGLLFKSNEVNKENLARDPKKSTAYSLGNAEKIERAISQILSQLAT
ncbi:hypothetical protein [Vreelandella venusta]|uniref:hypothetical protein n=1 Tax=Vreelandella venusta TaxID=44935 RepID=UPI0038500F09